MRDGLAGPPTMAGGVGEWGGVSFHVMFPFVVLPISFSIIPKP